MPYGGWKEDVDWLGTFAPLCTTALAMLVPPSPRHRTDIAHEMGLFGSRAYISGSVVEMSLDYGL